MTPEDLKVTLILMGFKESVQTKSIARWIMNKNEIWVYYNKDKSMSISFAFENKNHFDMINTPEEILLILESVL